jgi:hypothetical protein
VVDVLEDRSLLSAPTVINPIDDILVHRDRTERVAAGFDSPLVSSPRRRAISIGCSSWRRPGRFGFWI